MEFDWIFFVNSRIRFFKITLLDCEQYEMNQYKRQENNHHCSVFKLLR